MIILLTETIIFSTYFIPNIKEYVKMLFSLYTPF